MPFILEVPLSTGDFRFFGALAFIRITKILDIAYYGKYNVVCRGREECAYGKKRTSKIGCYKRAYRDYKDV